MREERKKERKKGSWKEKERRGWGFSNTLGWPLTEHEIKTAEAKQLSTASPDSRYSAKSIETDWLQARLTVFL